jgi:hypothetical protein
VCAYVCVCDVCPQQQLRLSYKAEVNVDQVVRVKGPEQTSTGYDIHIWVRDGRQTKHHTVSTRTAAEAQQWIEGVQSAKGRSMTLGMGMGIGDGASPSPGTAAGISAGAADTSREIDSNSSSASGMQLSGLSDISKGSQQQEISAGL